MKKIASVFFALILICSFVLPVFSFSAESGRYAYDCGLDSTLTDEQITSLDGELARLDETYDMTLYILIKSGEPESSAQYCADSFMLESDLGSEGDGGAVVSLDCDAREFIICPYGFCNEVFTDSAKSEIISATELFFDKTANTYDYYNMCLNLVKDVTYFYTAKRPDKNGSYAPNYEYSAPSSGGAFVTDDCDLFTDEQEAALQTKLDAFRAKYANDLVLHTTNSLNGKIVADYADDYYDYNGYANDGLLFMVCMAGGEGNRDYYTSTKGYALTAFNDYSRGMAEEEVVPLLASGDYYEAFDKFIDMADFVYAQAATGEPFDTNNPYRSTTDYIFYEAFAAIAAAVIAFVVYLVLKSRMNTAVAKNDARDYVVANSLNVTGSQDVFAFSTVSKTEIPVETSSSSSGGGSHTSSSGSSHGGGGGKF